jgi:hypothetical protein
MHLRHTSILRVRPAARRSFLQGSAQRRCVAPNRHVLRLETERLAARYRRGCCDSKYRCHASYGWEPRPLEPAPSTFA